MPGGDAVSADLPRRQQQLVKLQVIVAKRTGNWRTPGEILRHKRLDHIALETRLLIDDVVGHVELLGHPARIVHVVDRAAAPLDLLRHALVAGEATLVPELQRQADQLVTLGTQHRRHG